MRYVVALLFVTACGTVKNPHPDIDAPPADDAAIDSPADAPIDVPPDAPTVEMKLITSVLMFPTPHEQVLDFSAGELSGAGIASTGCSQGGGPAVSGNPDAPSGGAFCGTSSSANVVSFVFASPIHGFGLSVMDIDFTQDGIVNVTVAGLNTMDQPVMTHTRALQPANSQAEEDNGSLFIGWTTPGEVVKVQVTLSLSNTTKLDNLVFFH